MIAKVLRPQVLIPAILIAGIIAALLSFADLKKLLGLMMGFRHIYLLWFLLLIVAYETVRCTQWHYLLKSMGIHVPLRAQVFAYVGGEVTKTMPIGNYFQNYLLQQAQGTDFGLSSAATTLIVLTEVGVSLVGVVIIGIGDWSSWLRPVIMIGVPVAAFVAWAIHKVYHGGKPPEWMSRHKALRMALDEFRQFREGAAALFHPRIIAVEVMLGATYLVIAGAALYLVVRGLGITTISFWQVLAVYFFSLAFALIFPLPIDVGITELSGVGAFLAIGVDRNAAVGAMLINRVLSIGAALTIALIVMVFLRDQLGAAIQQRRGQQSAPPLAPVRDDGVGIRD